ncbi:unnamed protein product [Lactuca saligna]|uniref:Ionotropic glutamate receptor C-terminal domain-containing protein n=1 Tax=Lactuca saligna TaxID=75948 RepID=A0AA35Z5W3_LACSI|nr:unnamed protein product [Lactuca saligna]
MKMYSSASCLINLVAFSMLWFLLQASVISANFSIGVILDQASRPGKEAKVAIEIAIQDFNIKTNQTIGLNHQNSRNKPLHAAIAAKHLIDEDNVKAILGGHNWEEASAIAEVISEADQNVPVFLSLSTTPQATHQWPFFFQAVPTQSTQMNAVVAILQSWGIRQVTLIYEASHLSSTASIISHLSQAFRQTGSELNHIVPLTSASCLLEEELEVLKKQQVKVFVIHTSLELGIRLFQAAKKMEMTGDGYLWIATNGITDSFHSINSSMISSMKGMIGVKSYFPENTPEFRDFSKRFRRKFSSDYPEEEEDEPGIFAVQGYNAVKLFEEISPENFDHKILPPQSIVEIVKVVGKGYHSVYWTEGSGFSETMDDDINGVTTYTNSMDSVGQALWPMQPWYANKRRRNLAENPEIRMRVGVPGRSLFKQFVNVEYNPKNNETVISGFVIAVFDEIMREMKLPYDYFPFYGSYDELMRQIPAEQFDAIAGDVTIVARRHEYVDFTQPYTESGLEMIVPIRSKLSNQPWLFMKPFTAQMWWLIAAITLYNGFIIWLIEVPFTNLQTFTNLKCRRFTHNRFQGTSCIAICQEWQVSFGYLALIITQSYTASFASMLTAQRLEPTITSVEMLRNMNATVGYCNGSFINYYLKDVLGFNSFKVNSYNSTHRYAEALNSGEIAAIFLEAPVAKVFLAQYCKSFVRTGETFKVGGFGFAFPKEFSWLSDANKALMNVSESGKLKELEDTFLTSEKCVDDESFPNEDESLSPLSFSILFVLTGGTSTVALVVYVVMSIRKFKESNPGVTNIFELIYEFMKDKWYQRGHSSRVVADAQSPTGLQMGPVNTS